jgi:hypothetical protein
MHGRFDRHSQAWGQVHHAFGRTAQHGMRETGTPVRGDDDEINVVVFDHLDNLLVGHASR